MYKSVRLLFHSLNTNLVILWKIELRILMYRLVLKPRPPLRWGFAKFSPLPPQRVRRQKHVFKHNSAPNYLTMTKLHKMRVDMNAEKSFFGDFGIFNFKWW